MRIFPAIYVNADLDPDLRLLMTAFDLVSSPCYSLYGLSKRDNVSREFREQDRSEAYNTLRRWKAMLKIKISY